MTKGKFAVSLPEVRGGVSLMSYLMGNDLKAMWLRVALVLAIGTVIALPIL